MSTQNISNEDIAIEITITYDEKNENILEATTKSNAPITLHKNNTFEILLKNSVPQNQIPNFKKLLLIFEFFVTQSKTGESNPTEKMPDGTNPFTGLGDYVVFSFSQSKQGIISRRLVPSWDVEGMNNTKEWNVNVWIADFSEGGNSNNLIYVNPIDTTAVPTFIIKV